MKEKESMDYKDIKISNEWNIPVVEDAAEALGDILDGLHADFGDGLANDFFNHMEVSKIHCSMCNNVSTHIDTKS